MEIDFMAAMKKTTPSATDVAAYTFKPALKKDDAPRFREQMNRALRETDRRAEPVERKATSTRKEKVSENSVARRGGARENKERTVATEGHRAATEENTVKKADSAEKAEQGTAAAQSRTASVNADNAAVATVAAASSSDTGFQAIVVAASSGDTTLAAATQSAELVSAGANTALAGQALTPDATVAVDNATTTPSLSDPKLAPAASRADAEAVMVAELSATAGQPEDAAPPQVAQRNQTPPASATAGTTNDTKLTPEQQAVAAATAGTVAAVATKAGEAVASQTLSAAPAEPVLAADAIKAAALNLESTATREQAAAPERADAGSNVEELPEFMREMMANAEVEAEATTAKAAAGAATAAKAAFSQQWLPAQAKHALTGEAGSLVTAGGVTHSQPMTGAIKTTLATQAAAPELSEQEFVNQVADRILLQVREGRNEMRISLRPEHLGQLEIHAQSGHGGLMARIVTESSEVKHLLESNLQTLQHSLEERGLKVDRIHIVVGEGADAAGFTLAGGQTGHAGRDNAYNQSRAGWSGVAAQGNDAVAGSDDGQRVHADARFYAVA